MVYRNTSNNSDPRTVPGGNKTRDGLNPDITTYDRELQPSNKAGHIPDFTIADRVDEFKFHPPKHDAFDDDPKHPFEKQTDHGIDTRNQICSYASGLLQLQFRFFTFSILLMRTHARLIRWDRAGAVVTQAFEVEPEDDPSPLAEFIWRYSHMNRAQRGFDDSVRLVDDSYTSGEVEEAREKLVKEEEKRMPGTQGMHSDRKLYFLHKNPQPTDPASAGGMLEFAVFEAGVVAESRNANAEPDGKKKSNEKGKEKTKPERNGYFLLSPPLRFRSESLR